LIQNVRNVGISLSLPSVNRYKLTLYKRNTHLVKRNTQLALKLKLMPHNIITFLK